jgi:hypothetical protein
MHMVLANLSYMQKLSPLKSAYGTGGARLLLKLWAWIPDVEGAVPGWT